MGRRIYSEHPAIPMTAVGKLVFDIENADSWCMEVTSVKGGATNFIYQMDIAWADKTWTQLTKSWSTTYNGATEIGTAGEVTETNDETNYYYFARPNLLLFGTAVEARDLNLADKIRMNLTVITDDAGASVLTVTVHTWTIS